MAEMDEKGPAKTSPQRVVAAIGCLLAGPTVLGIAAVDPFEFTSDATVLCTLGGAGLLLLGIGLLAPRVATGLLELIFEFTMWP